MLKPRKPNLLTYLSLIVFTVGIVGGVYATTNPKSINYSKALGSFKPPKDFNECFVGDYDCEASCPPGTVSKCFSGVRTSKWECVEDQNNPCLSTPTPSSTPEPTANTANTCTTGTCFPGLSNCGEVGKDSGSGTCTGGLCCVDRATNLLSPPTCNVSYSSSAYVSKFAVGSSATITANVDVNNGSVQSVLFSQVSQSPSGSQIFTFSSYNLKQFTDRNEPFQVIANASSPGSAKIQILATVYNEAGYNKCTTTTPTITVY